MSKKTYKNERESPPQSNSDRLKDHLIWESRSNSRQTLKTSKRILAPLAVCSLSRLRGGSPCGGIMKINDSIPLSPLSPFAARLFPTEKVTVSSAAATKGELMRPKSASRAEIYPTRKNFSSLLPRFIRAKGKQKRKLN